MVFYFQLQTQLGSLIMIFFLYFCIMDCFRFMTVAAFSPRYWVVSVGPRFRPPSPPPRTWWRSSSWQTGLNTTLASWPHTLRPQQVRALHSIFRPVDWSAICCLCFSWENSSTIGTFVMDTNYCIKSGFHRIQTWAQQNTSSALIFTKLVSMLHQ